MADPDRTSQAQEIFRQLRANQTGEDENVSGEMEDERVIETTDPGQPGREQPSVKHGEAVAPGSLPEGPEAAGGDPAPSGSPEQPGATPAAATQGEAPASAPLIDATEPGPDEDMAPPTADDAHAAGDEGIPAHDQFASTYEAPADDPTTAAAPPLPSTDEAPAPVEASGGASTPASGPWGRAKHPGTAHPLPRRFAIANQKGGVGKTTTAVNLGAALAELGYRVLVVDLDPQGNATTGLGINARNLEASIYDVILHDAPVDDVIEPSNLRNLFVVPATIDLAGAEIELVPVFSRELRLRKALDAIEDDFDFVFIDCPPSLGLLTVNGLAAATEVAVPIQCEYYALEGLGQLLRNVGLVQTNLNADLEVSTIILTMYDARTKLAEQVAGEVRQHFGDRVCRNIVPRTVRLSEAPSFGQPIIVFDPSSRGAIAYRELAKEVSGGAPQRIG